MVLLSLFVLLHDYRLSGALMSELFLLSVCWWQAAAQILTAEIFLMSAHSSSGTQIISRSSASRRSSSSWRPWRFWRSSCSWKLQGWATAQPRRGPQAWSAPVHPYPCLWGSFAARDAVWGMGWACNMCIYIYICSYSCLRAHKQTHISENQCVGHATHVLVENGLAGLSARAQPGPDPGPRTRLWKTGGKKQI